MARTRPNLLWRSMPTPRSTVDTCELQTLAYDGNTKKPEWVSVARGEPSAIEMIAQRLSADRFRMFPLTENEPGWPRMEGKIDEDDEDMDEQPLPGERASEAEVSSSGLTGSSSTTRRPAIREGRARRTLSGAAARSAQTKKEREDAEKRDGT